MYHSPSHLLSCYRTIYVPTLSGPAIGPLEVSHYQAASAGATPAQQRVKNEVIESIYEALGRHRDERPDIEVPQEWRQLFPAGRIVKVRIAHAFNGGGSPDEIREMLAAAVASRYLPADRGRLAEFMSRYVGLDCCGFVGNYFQGNNVRLAGSDADPVPSPRTPPQNYVGISTLIRNREDVGPDAVLLFPRTERSARHIAVVDWRMQEHCMVCESHGGFGPDRRDYVLLGGPNPADAGTIPGTEHLPEGERLTFRFRHPRAGRPIDVMVRRITPRPRT